MQKMRREVECAGMMCVSYELRSGRGAVSLNLERGKNKENILQGGGCIYYLSSKYYYVFYVIVKHYC